MSEASSSELSDSDPPASPEQPVEVGGVSLPLEDAAIPPAPTVKETPSPVPLPDPGLDLGQIQADTQHLQEVINSATTSRIAPLVEDPIEQVTKKYNAPVRSRDHPRGISNPEVEPLATSGPTDPVL